MLKRVILLGVLLSLFAVLFKAFYLKYAEPYAQEKIFPLSEPLTVEFETKLSKKYKVVVALRPSKELGEAVQKTYGGDAYESSANLGRYMLYGAKVRVTGLTDPDINFRETFSIFGADPLTSVSDYVWDPHANYELATFDGQRGNRYRLTIIQEPNAASPGKPHVPAYVMVREAINWTAVLIYLAFIGFILALVGIFFGGVVAMFRGIRRLFRHLITDNSTGPGA